MIGKMKPIRLIQYTTAQNANGRATETAAASYNVWADLSNKTSARTADNGQTQLVNTLVFRLFSRAALDVSGNWRIVWAGREYTVQGIDRIEERKFNWQITATASGKS
jgi:head-tail adaptor